MTSLPPAPGRRARHLRFRAGFALAVFAAALAGGPSPAFAQNPLSIELNKLEDQPEACRAYLVLKNETGTRFDVLTLDLVVFDTKGGISKRLALEAAPLPVGKTRVKLVDIRDVTCGQIGRILFNGVLACKDDTLSERDCAAAIVPSSRLAVPFDK